MTRALGVEAFSFGDRVALRSDAPLPVVAHEVAHVLQQREMSALGIHRSTVELERDADRVADRVSQGQTTRFQHARLGRIRRPRFLAKASPSWRMERRWMPSGYGWNYLIHPFSKGSSHVHHKAALKKRLSQTVTVDVQHMLRSWSKVYCAVIGYTDGSGSDRVNRKLRRERADAMMPLVRRAVSDGVSRAPQLSYRPAPSYYTALNPGLGSLKPGAKVPKHDPRHRSCEIILHTGGTNQVQKKNYLRGGASSRALWTMKSFVDELRTLVQEYFSTSSLIWRSAWVYKLARLVKFGLPAIQRRSEWAKMGSWPPALKALLRKKRVKVAKKSIPLTQALQKLIMYESWGVKDLRSPTKRAGEFPSQLRDLAIGLGVDPTTLAKATSALHLGKKGLKKPARVFLGKGGVLGTFQPQLHTYRYRTRSLDLGILNVSYVWGFIDFEHIKSRFTNAKVRKRIMLKYKGGGGEAGVPLGRNLETGEKVTRAKKIWDAIAKFNKVDTAGKANKLARSKDIFTTSTWSTISLPFELRPEDLEGTFTHITGPTAALAIKFGASYGLGGMIFHGVFPFKVSTTGLSTTTDDFKLSLSAIGIQKGWSWWMKD